MIKRCRSTSLFLVLLLLIGLSVISDKLQQTTDITTGAYSAQSANNERSCTANWAIRTTSPPAGSAHGPAMHNDAAFVSGPHGQMQHDPYNLFMQQICPQYPPLAEVAGYPDQAGDVTTFSGLNPAG